MTKRNMSIYWYFNPVLNPQWSEDEDTNMALTKSRVEEMRRVLLGYWEGAGHSPEAPNALCDAALCWLHARETNMIRDGLDGVNLIASQVLAGE